MDITKLGYLYNLSKEDVKKHYKYLNIPINELCCFYDPIPFVDINPYDFHTPIEHLKMYFSSINKSDILEQVLLASYELEKTKFLEYDNDNKDSKFYDHVYLQYIQNRPKIFILTVWPIASKYINELVLFLQKNGIVYTLKKISLSYLGAQNLLFHLYSKIILSKNTIERKLRFINSKLEYVEFNKNEKTDFYVIVFDNINDLPISGTGADFKTQLRQHFYNIIKTKNPTKNVELNDIVHINDFFYETIEYAQIYFHNQTLMNLEKRNIYNFLSDSFQSSFLKINAFKNWMIKNLTLIEQQRLLLLTGSCFYTLGLRKSSDIDAIFINIKQDNNREKELEQIVYNDLFNEKTKIEFIDSGMPETIAWKDSWTKSNNDFYSTLTPKLDDCIICMNPDMYYYFNGLKIMTFDMTLLFKQHRYIPSDYVDFIILKEIYPRITELELFLNRDLIWKNKKDRNIKKINELIIKSFQRYMEKDKRRINITKYLL